MNVWKMLSEQPQPLGSRVETLQLRPSVITCSCETQKSKLEALGQSEDVVFLLVRAGGCQQFRLLCCETLYGAGLWK